MQTNLLRVAGFAAILATGVATGAIAHVTLDASKAPSGSYYKAVFNVPHGCEGSPTVRLRVQIPDGVTSVKPQPRSGWKLQIVKTRLAKPVEVDHGRTVTEAVTEVVWSGGRLLDENFEEFRIQVKLPDRPGETIWFPVVQECEKGVNRWIEIPAAGKSAHDLKQPAPGVALAPKS